MPTFRTAVWFFITGLQSIRVSMSKTTKRKERLTQCLVKTCHKSGFLFLMNYRRDINFGILA